MHGRDHAAGGSDPIGDDLIANTAYIWDDSGGPDNPVIAFDHPVTLISYAVDNSAGVSNVHVLIGDSADVGEDTPNAAWLPGPAELGSNSQFPRKFANGIWLGVFQDDFSTVVPSGTATVKVTLNVYDPTLA